MTNKEAVALMRSSQTPEEWSRNAVAIQSLTGGQWPEGFWDELVTSGAFSEFNRRIDRMEAARVMAVHP